MIHVLITTVVMTGTGQVSVHTSTVPLTTVEDARKAVYAVNSASAPSGFSHYKQYAVVLNDPHARR